MKSSAITKSAEGEKCTCRISENCKYNDTSTTIFAHAQSQAKGMGNKSPDYWGAYACNECHDLLDRRGNEWREFGLHELTNCWLRAIFETQQILVEKGLMNFKHDKKKPKTVSKKVENYGLYTRTKKD